ncbi:hypothetical protein CXF78_00850, partial [Shewanella sp. 11B5]
LLYLSYGIFYIIPFIFLFEFSFVIMKIYEKVLYKSDLFVAILIIHGMQMEVPYTVGLLVKLFVVGLFIYCISFFLPKRKMML